MIGNVAYTIVILGIVLGVLVFVHELGHYIAAKAFGVWVHRFAIGIGKPIPGLTFRRGETEWAIAWLPLGGYVKMASREHEPASSVLEGDSAEAVPADRVFEANMVTNFESLFDSWLIDTLIYGESGIEILSTTPLELIAVEPG